MVSLVHAVQNDGCNTICSVERPTPFSGIGLQEQPAILQKCDTEIIGSTELTIIHRKRMQGLKHKVVNLVPSNIELVFYFHECVERCHFSAMADIGLYGCHQG